VTVITFDGLTLPVPTPLKFKQTADSLEITIEGHSEDEATVDSLIAKAGNSTKALLLSGKTAIQTTGTKASLVIGSDTYTNCVIMGGVEKTEEEGTGPTPKWRYKATFAQDTA